MGIDSLIEEIMTGLGSVEHVYILDDYALGKDSGLIDLLIVGMVDRDKLEQLRQVAEQKINRTIRIISQDPDQFEENKEVFLSRPNWKVI